MQKQKINNILFACGFFIWACLLFYSNIINPVKYENIPKNVQELPDIFNMKMTEITQGLPAPAEKQSYYKPSVDFGSLTYDYPSLDNKDLARLLENIKHSNWIEVENEDTSDSFLSYCNKQHYSLQLYQHDKPYIKNKFSIRIFVEQRSYCISSFGA
ncbi:MULTISPECIES: hypothetical protein [unclassified Acinetobacter]|uniref:hypothetical protein n=1 Tax=unclassified Acinetobacter TaxID=196816 RepID=UPI0035BB3822